jgi:NTE family protein
MSRVGLVLGGGGVTGAAFHFGTLFALRMATGWDPGDADVIVGTSSGAVVAALARNRRLSVESLVGDVDGGIELSEALARRIYRRNRLHGLGRWMRHGILPGLRRPGLRLAVGSPAPYSTDGIAEWLRASLGDAATTWPDRPTTIVAYEIESRTRVAFGTEGSPDTDLVTAVAASSAVPMVFEPVAIDGHRYVDGGVLSGTNADLVLGAPEPLDLVLVIAPMAAAETRPGARFYEGVFDRLGSQALAAELEAVTAAWPQTEVLVLRPDESILSETRPNPLSTAAALPAFLTTLRVMRATLAGPEVWPVLARHLIPTRRRLPWGRRLRIGLSRS